MLKKEGAAGRRTYDLVARTQRFGLAVLAYARGLPVTPVMRPLITQFVRAGTSVGANYCEADGSESKKDFRHRIAVCRREARETCYWLAMLGEVRPGDSAALARLRREAEELTLIFSASIRTLEKGGA